MADYRDDDQTIGYCPQCGRQLANLTTGLRGYCEQHGWTFADWHRYTRTGTERWAEDAGELDYLRTEQKMDEAGLL